MAYRSYPDSIPPDSGHNFDIGSYKSSLNHHIIDNEMSVNAYSLNQGIGRELASVFNFINGRNVGLPTKKIVSGCFYSLGISGQSDWWNSSTCVQNVYCRSGYLYNYQPISYSGLFYNLYVYGNFTLSGNLYPGRDVGGNTARLDLVYSGYINPDQTYYINNNTAVMDLLTGTYFYFDFINGTGRINQDFEKSTYPAMLLDGYLYADNTYLNSGIMNNSGIYITCMGVSGDSQSIAYNTVSGHNHIGTGNLGSQIEIYGVISSTGFWNADMSTKNLMGCTLNITGYYYNPGMIWSGITERNFDNVIRRNNRLWLNNKSGETSSEIWTYDGNTWDKVFDYNGSGYLYGRPAILGNTIVFLGYRPSGIFPCPVTGTIIRSDDGWIWTEEIIRINEENTEPCDSGDFLPKYIAFHNEKYYLFGHQHGTGLINGSGMPKVLYITGIISPGYFQPYDETTVRASSGHLKRPIIYHTGLYFHDYANSLYRIPDFDQNAELIVSGSVVQSGDYIVYKDKIFGESVFYIASGADLASPSSGNYSTNFRMRDSYLVNNQLLYVNQDHDLYQLRNNEKKLILATTSGLTTDYNKLIEVANGFLYFVDGSGRLNYRTMDVNLLYLDSYNEEI